MTEEINSQSRERRGKLDQSKQGNRRSYGKIMGCSTCQWDLIHVSFGRAVAVMNYGTLSTFMHTTIILFWVWVITVVMSNIHSMMVTFFCQNLPEQKCRPKRSHN
ncbi:hypothetical protein KSP39_PZI007078 [Platanthera zijinensis]|uniref:Uncharacterized protein n=1 Tax=Platanthera zijinensis TaxID=2320716 RepID=A0AAP0BPA6_9ASPA